MINQDRLRDIMENRSAFARHMGIEMIEVSEDRLIMDLPVSEALTNRNGVMHGGAILGLTDHAGGTATMIRLAEGTTTATVESKVNFLRPIRLGDTARATVTPVQLGRTMQVWDIAVTRGDGKLAARVTQTQMVMIWKDPDPI